MSILEFVAKNRIIYVRFAILGVALVLAFATMQLTLMEVSLTPRRYTIPAMLGTIVGVLVATLVALRREVMEGQRMFRAVADMAQEFIYVRRLDGSYEYVSPSCEQVTGYSAADFYAQPNFMGGLIHIDDQPGWDRLVHRMDHQGIPQKLVVRIQTRSGDIRWIEHLCSDVRDMQGAIVGTRSVNLDITGRIEHEQALSVAAVAFETHEAIVITDRNSRIVRVNRAFSDISGYEADEVMGRTPEFLKSGRHDEAFYQAMRETLRTRKRWSGELWDLRKNGEVYPKFLTITAVPDASGEIAFYVGIFSDITERKQADKALRDAKEKFQSLVESSSDWIWEVDENGIYTYASPKIKDLLGYEPHEVIGKTPLDLMAPEENVRVGRLFEEIIRAKAPFTGLENSNLHKDGHIVILETSGAPVFDGEGVLRGYRGVDRDITERKQSEREIHQLAFYDALTGLPNRRLLLDRLRQATAVGTRSGRYGAVLFLDLDNFKKTNDTQGHLVGDLLLIEVSKRLRNCVRDGDSVARLGGDEFVVVLEELGHQLDVTATQAEQVAEKIRQELDRPYALQKHECHSSASIGICLFHAHEDEVESLLRQADIAMYQAKSAGRNAIRFFDPLMQTALDKRAALESDLRQALARQQLRLHYQVQVDSRGRATGAEVLLRWEHPDRGFVFPQVQQALQESGAKPSQLKLELTESTVLENVENAIARMQEIKLLGVDFSMDDFGTGYSSLAYLKRLPLDQIKIDRTFVSDITCDPNDAAIVQAIIAMTGALGLNVIAEGVETVAQRDFLDKHGCHAYQGYLFSKPVPVDAFEASLTSG